MFERDAAAHRLVGYLEEAMKNIDRICDQTAPTKIDKDTQIAMIKNIATKAIERARLLP